MKLHPLPQPDLAAEIEQLRLENAAMKTEWENAYEIGMLAKQQLAEAQASEEELLKALEIASNQMRKCDYTPALSTILQAITAHKARKER